LALTTRGAVPGALVAIHSIVAPGGTVVVRLPQKPITRFTTVKLAIVLRLYNDHPTVPIEPPGNVVMQGAEQPVSFFVIERIDALEYRIDLVHSDVHPPLSILRSRK